MLLTLLLGFHPYSWGLIVPAILVMLSIASVFSALGIGLASLLTDIQGYQLITNFVVMPMVFVSGALFPLTNVPPLLQALASIDPLSYGVDGIKELYAKPTQYGFEKGVVYSKELGAASDRTDKHSAVIFPFYTQTGRTGSPRSEYQIRVPIYAAPPGVEPLTQDSVQDQPQSGREFSTPS
jgi:hypothetical protein